MIKHEWYTWTDPWYSLRKAYRFQMGFSGLPEEVYTFLNHPFLKDVAWGVYAGSYESGFESCFHL